MFDVSVIEVKLSDVCRGCLGRSPEMRSFFPKNDNTSHIIAMLSSVGNFEVDLNEDSPLHLCQDCEQKLQVSYEFQLLIQKSNDIIKQCLNGAEFILESGDENNLGMRIKTWKTQSMSSVPPNELEEVIKDCKEKLHTDNRCIKCDLVCHSRRALSVHMAHLHKQTKEHWCLICNSEVDILAEHLISHSQVDLRCKFCDKMFNSRDRYLDHLLSHSSNTNVSNQSTQHTIELRPHKCHSCEKSFTTIWHLNKHSRSHKCPEIDSRSHELQNFCKLCCRRIRSLSEHTARFHNSKKTAKDKGDGILCTICGKKFKGYSMFRIHMRTHTGEAPYKCSFCDKRTTSRNQMVVHERTHTGEKPHVCSICGKGFAQSSVLGTHMKIHTGRPEVCAICSKSFCRPAQLRLHMRKHTGEKPYQCNQCELAFKQKSHLSEHLKTHSDERPYKCTHCDKGFKQSSSLRSHIQIHLGEKPYKCSQCPYACRQSYSLTQHMRQHSSDTPRPDKPHSCSICEKRFSTIAMLTSHVNAVHNIFNM